MRRQYVTDAPHFVVRIDGRVTRPTPNYLALRASEDCECQHLVNVENGKPDPLSSRDIFGYLTQPLTSVKRN